jgi:hypothetical protein
LAEARLIGLPRLCALQNTPNAKPLKYPLIHRKRFDMSLLSIFRRPDYRSDLTQFIDQLKVDRPHLDAAQQEGRALLWDASVDRHVLKEFNEGRVAQKPYVYQTKG